MSTGRDTHTDTDTDAGRGADSCQELWMRAVAFCIYEIFWKCGHAIVQKFVVLGF